MGIELLFDGTTYEGYYKNGLKHGKGVLKVIDGSYYEGDFRFNKLEGEGLYVWHE